MGTALLEGSYRASLHPLVQMVVPNLPDILPGTHLVRAGHRRPDGTRRAVPLTDHLAPAEHEQGSDAVPLHLAMIQLLRRLIPFLVTGVTNSIVGFSVIFLCLAVGTGGIAANIIGYAVALTCSFVLNRHYVFGVRGAISYAEIGRFLLVFTVAFSINMGVLLMTQSVLGESSAVAQVIAVAAYTLVFYPLSRIFVFKRETTG